MQLLAPYPHNAYWETQPISSIMKNKIKKKVETMIDMRFDEGKTLIEIGKHFGISGERVRQHIGNTSHLSLRQVSWYCPACGKMKRLQPHMAKIKKACSKKCRAVSFGKYGVIRSDPEYEKIRRLDPKNKKRMHIYYKNRWNADAAYREKRKAEMRAYYRKTKKA